MQNEMNSGPRNLGLSFCLSAMIVEMDDNPRSGMSLQTNRASQSVEFQGLR